MKKSISILLCLVILAGMFTGCTPAHTPEAYIPTGDALEQDTYLEETKPAEADEQTMSLSYYPDKSMNPITTTDYTNRVVTSLVYQGLFAVSREYEVIPILCKKYTVSSDMMTYTFTIDPTATFSDGTPVTADDVCESLREARSSTYYSGRFRLIKSIDSTEDGKVQLLLDIPIVKAAQTEDEFPLGTGPYVMGGYGTRRYLIRHNNWWCKSKDLLITAEKIPLLPVESVTQIRDNFEFADDGVVCTDPGSDRYVEYRCDYELWDCETGLFLFLGVNKESAVFKKKELRQALSKGIDRDALVDKYYRGFAKAAELPVSPNSPYYMPTLAQQYAYDALMYQSLMSGVQGRTVTLLVHQGDSLRVKVAQEIGRMLNTSGLIVEVVSLDRNDYFTALEEGNYDLYLGQTRLSANMDLSPFFSSNGALNYGGLDDISIYTLCLQALENRGNYYTLHQTVMDEAYLCPILFRSYAIYAARGLLTQLQPARDNIFCYSIGKTIEDAYTQASE